MLGAGWGKLWQEINAPMELSEFGGGHALMTITPFYSLMLSMSS
jgi:hypothetical protein